MAQSTISLASMGTSREFICARNARLVENESHRKKILNVADIRIFNYNNNQRNVIKRAQP